MESEYSNEVFNHEKDQAKASRNEVALVACVLCLVAGGVAWHGMMYVALLILGVTVIVASVAGFFHFVYSAPTAASNIKRREYYMYVHPAAITAFSFLLIYMDSLAVSMQIRNLYMVVPPDALTREVGSMSNSNSILPFIVGAISHLILAVVAFGHGELGGIQWIATLIIADISLLNLARAKLKATQDNLLSNARTHADVARVISSLCDAAVSVDSQWRVLNSVELARFAALLGRNEKTMPGRCLSEFVHWEDCERMSAHIDEVTHASSQEGEGSSKERRATASLAIRLADLYAIPVSVNIFYVCHRSPNKPAMYHVGICEAWKPKEGNNSKVSRHCSRSEKAMPPETGFLMPLESDSPGRSKSPATQRRQRCDSPRPVHQKSDSESLRPTLVLRSSGKRL